MNGFKYFINLPPKNFTFRGWTVKTLFKQLLILYVF